MILKLGDNIAFGSTTETVTLPNGKTYKVEVENNMPVPAKNSHFRVEMLSFLMETETHSLNWALGGQLHDAGQFDVKVTSLIDDSVAASFRVTGPGKILELFFPSTKYPTMWKWVTDGSTSWVPFVFTFKNISTGKQFEIMQWSKFDPDVKVRVFQLVKQEERRQQTR